MSGIPEWLKSWISPSGMLLVLGGVIWGVQLNVAVMKLTEQMAIQHNELNTVSETMAEVSINNARTALILQQIQKDDESIKSSLEKHLENSEKWKRRVIQLEERNKYITRGQNND